LALLADNVTKPRNFYKSTNLERANSGQVRVETVVIERIQGICVNKEVDNLAKRF